MKKKTLFILISLMLIFSACGMKDANRKDEVVQSREIKTESQIEKQIENEESDVANSIDSAEQSENNTTVEELSFEYLSNYEFEFASGAGGWSTNFTIEKDGYFKGTYHDSEMGDVGEYYPNGSMYYSNFAGHFKELRAVEQYKYEMTLADINYKNEIGDEDIFDEVRYIYTDAYGLTGTDKFYVYLPGYLVASLDEEVYNWVMWVNDNQDVLSVPIIVNVNENEGIYSYPRTGIADDASMTYGAYTESYNYYVQLLQEDNTQNMYNSLAKRQFEVVDEGLNYLWNLVKYHTNEAGFQAILEDQRQWNADKEAAANAESAKYEGGSMESMVYYTTLADWTYERLGVLYEYIVENAI